MEPIRIVHYLNQFFGQLGGEELAGIKPQIKSEAIGPGRVLQARLGASFEVVATAICGDNTFADNPEAAAEDLTALISEFRPQILIAGPAFNSGRYGQACGQLCASIQEKLAIPAITGMYQENPAVDQFRNRVLIVRTGPTARTMGEAIDQIVSLVKRIAAGDPLDRPAELGCFPHGMKRPVVREQIAARRAIDMLLSKLTGQPFTTEMSVPVFDRVEPTRLKLPLSEATVALVTDGGLVAKGNPERMPNGYTDRITAIPIHGLDRFTTDIVEAHHGGYDTQFVNQDLNRLTPLDAARELERNGVIGKLHETVYATAGLGMSISNAKKVGREIGRRLLDQGVQAVILTST
ncbi:MAG: glycine/betaine/sarcosine/D-proline family reductase selenoprotein B [Candidatus Binataceae bacterium]|nr:glycine/betaine/sarcosine/D-proline family reductase selenoprotein B [Candidatus Binataceae bacterium]